MNTKNKAIRGRFLATLESFRQEGYLYTTFRTGENAVAGIPLKGFRSKSEVNEFIKNQFAPGEAPSVVESIDAVIKDVQEGRIRNWRDFLEIQQYFKEKQPAGKAGELDDLLQKNRDRSEGNKRSLL